MAALVSVAMVVRAQVLWPTWPPRGADWALWYSSAAWLFHDVEWPVVRWPLWGLLVGLVDPLVPGPLFVAAMVSSMVCTGFAAGATWAIVRPIAGPGAALAGVALLVLHPLSLRMGGWIGAYTMWAATGPLAAAALAGAVRHDRASAWRWAGIALAVTLAVQEKGILTAAGLAPAVALALLLRGRAGARPRLVGLLVPVLALALAYAAFPEPLASLDAQAAAQVSGPGALPSMVPMTGAPTPAPVPPPPPPEGGLPADGRPGERGIDMGQRGWIFGKQMGPTVLLGLAATALHPLPAALATAYARKVDLVFLNGFPGASPWVLPAIGVAGLVAFVGAIVRAVPTGRRGAGAAVSGAGVPGTTVPGVAVPGAGAADAPPSRADALVAVVALLGVAATALPALRTDFNLRYILAPAWVVPALLALAIGLLTDGGLAVLARLASRAGSAPPAAPFARARPWLRAAVPLAALAVLLGPLRVPSTWDFVGSPLVALGAESDPLAVRVWHDLSARFPDAVIDVHQPIAGGILAIDERGGRLLGRPELAAAETEPDRWLLVVAAADAAPPTIGETAEALGLTREPAPSLALARRRVASVWDKPDGQHLVLLGPVE